MGNDDFAIGVLALAAAHYEVGGCASCFVGIVDCWLGELGAGPVPVGEWVGWTKTTALRLLSSAQRGLGVWVSAYWYDSWFRLMIPTPRYDSSLPSSLPRYRLTLRLPDIDSLLSSLLPSRYGFINMDRSLLILFF